MVIAQPKSSLARIRIDSRADIPVAETSLRRRAVQQVRGVCELRELVVVGVPLRIERSEVEDPIFDERTTGFYVDVIVALVKNVSRTIEERTVGPRSKIVGLQTGTFHLLRRKEAAHGTMEIVRAALGDDLHDATGGLAVLRFEAAGLY